MDEKSITEKSLQGHNFAVFFIGVIIMCGGILPGYILSVILIPSDMIPRALSTQSETGIGVTLSLLFGISVFTIILIQWFLYTKVKSLTQRNIKISGIKIWLYFLTNFFVVMVVVVLGIFVSSGVYEVLFLG